MQLYNKRHNLTQLNIIWLSYVTAIVMLNGHGNELTTLLFFLFLIAKSDIHFDVYLHCRSKLQVASLKLTGNVIFHFGFLHILIWQKSLLNALDIITLLTTLFHDVALFFGKICCWCSTFLKFKLVVVFGEVKIVLWRRESMFILSN